MLILCINLIQFKYTILKQADFSSYVIENEQGTENNKFSSFKIFEIFKSIFELSVLIKSENR